MSHVIGKWWCALLVLGLLCVHELGAAEDLHKGPPWGAVFCPISLASLRPGVLGVSPLAGLAAAFTSIVLLGMMLFADEPS